MMKRKIKWLAVVFLILGVLVIAFAGWQFVRSNKNLLPVETAQNGLSDSDLVGDVTFQPVSTQMGKNPFFVDDPNTLYYQGVDGTLIKVSLDGDDPSESELFPFSVDPIITWREGTEWGLIEWQDSSEVGPTLGRVHKESFELETLLEDAWGGSWDPGNRITFLRSSDNGTMLWQMDSDGSQKKLLGPLTDISVPTTTAWSATGNRLLIQSGMGTEIVTVRQDVIVSVNFIAYAQETAWSPDGWMLAYRLPGEEKDALWMADVDGKEQRKLFEGVFSIFTWLPDGRLLFFTAGKENGADCWALDPLTGAMTLLAEAYQVFYKPVGAIALSPSGNAVAFQAQDYLVWLLTFDGSQ